MGVNEEVLAQMMKDSGAVKDVLVDLLIEPFEESFDKLVDNFFKELPKVTAHDRSVFLATLSSLLVSFCAHKIYQVQSAYCSGYPSAIESFDKFHEASKEYFSIIGQEKYVYFRAELEKELANSEAKPH